MIIRWRLTFVPALLGIVSLIGAVSLVHSASAGGDPVQAMTDGSLVDQVNRRVREWQPTPQERRFDEIGWARDIQTAERLAKQHGRPVFLFTHDGRMATGRC